MARQSLHHDRKTDVNLVYIDINKGSTMSNEMFQQKAGQAKNIVEQITNGDAGDVVTQNEDGSKSLKSSNSGVGSTTYRADSGITGPPDSGKVRWNNASQTSATQLFLSETNDNGSDLSNFLSNLEIGDAIAFQNNADSTNYQTWDVVGITDNGTDYTIDVTLLQSSGVDFTTSGQGMKLIMVIQKGAGTVQVLNEVLIQSFKATSAPVVSSGDLTEIYTYADPTSGNLILALPNPTIEPSGALRSVKRVQNGTNYVEITGNINGQVGNFILANNGDYVTLKNDGSTWQVWNQRTFSFASMMIVTPTTFSLTTSMTKLTSWDTDGYATYGRQIPDQANNKITLQQFNGPQEGYKLKMTLNFEYDANKWVAAQIYAEGALVGLPVYENGNGAGKPRSIEIIQDFGVTSLTDIEIYIQGESAGTLTILGASVENERIGG
jgi:hypothetical protein